MKNFFTNRVRVVLVVAVLVAVAAGVAAMLVPEGTIFQRVVATAMTPVESGAAALTRKAELIYDYLFKFEALQAENDALKEKIASMETDVGEAQAIQRENDRLTTLLGLVETHPDYSLVSAYVTGWDSSNWKPSCTIAKGESDGIALGMCAISHSGQVVGVVTAIGLNWSEITTILDPSLEISATITSSGYTGVVQGSYSYDGSLLMNYLPTEAVLKNTDLVVTAGSMLYPKGLTLGSIIDGGMDQSGIGKYAVLEPGVDFDGLEQVFIITDYVS
ncbi:MAG: rod shape-determining protein MreC [Eubacteriales bacterium]